MAKKMKKAREAAGADSAANRAAERLPLSGLTIHPVLSKVPPIQAIPLPGGGYLPPGPAQPVLVAEGGVVLDGREQVEAARRRGDTDVEAVVLRLDEEGQLEAVLAGACAVRRLSLDQLAVLAGHWLRADADRSKRQRARLAALAKARKVGGGCSEAASAPEQVRPPRARQRAADQYGIPQSLVRRAEELVRRDPELADRVLAGDLALKKAIRAAAREVVAPGRVAPAPGRPKTAAGEPQKDQAAGTEGPGKPPAQAAHPGEVSQSETRPAAGAVAPAPRETHDQAGRPQPAGREPAPRTGFLRNSQTAAEVAEVLRRQYPPALLRELAMLLLAGGDGGVTEPATPAVPQAVPEPTPPLAETAAGPGRSAGQVESAAPDAAPGRDEEADELCRRLLEKAGVRAPSRWLVGEAEAEAVVPLGGHGGARRREPVEKAGAALTKALRGWAGRLGAAFGLTTRRVVDATVRPAAGGAEGLAVSLHVGLVAPLPPDVGRPTDEAPPGVRWWVIDDDGPALRREVGQLLAGGPAGCRLTGHAEMVFNEATGGWSKRGRLATWGRPRAVASGVA